MAVEDRALHPLGVQPLHCAALDLAARRLGDGARLDQHDLVACDPVLGADAARDFRRFLRLFLLV